MRSREDLDALVREEFASSGNEEARAHVERRDQEEQADAALLRRARESRGH